MKRIAGIIPLMLILIAVAVPVTAQAAGRKTKNEVVMTIGNKIHLFHSSKVEAQKDIAVGDMLPVYRLTGKNQQEQKEVGQVKVLGFIGKHYFEAEIVKGKIKVGDIAMKEGSALLVQPAK